MKRKDDTIAILFVTILAVVIWIWSATRTENERVISTTLHYKAPEGQVTIPTERTNVRLTFKGPRASIDAVEEMCAQGLVIPIASEDGNITLIVKTSVNAIDSIRIAGAEVISADPSSVALHVQTLVAVEASVQYLLPSVQAVEVTIDPSTVTLQIPKQILNSLPESITVSAVVPESVLGQLEPGSKHERSAAIQLPESLEGKGIVVEPNRVTLSFKIQSKTDKTTLTQVRVLIAAPAEDYEKYKISLPVNIVPNVTIEAEKDLIASISSGQINVFAIVRLASRDIEQLVSSKHVTTFLAMLEDGTGKEVTATVEDQATLDVALEISPVEKP